MSSEQLSAGSPQRCCCFSGPFAARTGGGSGWRRRRDASQTPTPRQTSDLTRLNLLESPNAAAPSGNSAFHHFKPKKSNKKKKNSLVYFEGISEGARGPWVEVFTELKQTVCKLKGMTGPVSLQGLDSPPPTTTPRPPETSPEEHR